MFFQIENKGPIGLAKVKTKTFEMDIQMPIQGGKIYAILLYVGTLFAIEWGLKSPSPEKEQLTVSSCTGIFSRKFDIWWTKCAKAKFEFKSTGWQ